MNSPTNLDTLLKEILITPLVGAMMERGIKPSQSVDMVTLAESLCFGPPKPRKCECVTEYALNGNPDRIVEWANEKCPLCDGDGIQKRDKPACEECGEPSTHVLDSEDRAPTDQGTEVRNVKIYLCGKCYEQFWERAR